MRAGADVDLPGLLRRRRLARVRRLRRAAAGRALRGRRHEARAPLEAGLRAAALLLLRAGRADPGLDCPSGCTSCSARTSGRACASPTSSPTTTACASGSSRAVEAGIDVYPLPVSFCDALRLPEALRGPLASTDDHLSLVARMRRDQIAPARGRGHRHRRRARARVRRGAPADDGAAHVRDAARPGGDAGRRAHGRARVEGARARAGARLRAAAAAERRRPLLRHRGRPVLGARARARVPLGDRRHRRGVPAVLGARPRAGAARRRGRDRPDPRAPRAPTRRCTSTTTPPTR